MLRGRSRVNLGTWRRRHHPAIRPLPIFAFYLRAAPRRGTTHSPPTSEKSRPFANPQALFSSTVTACTEQRHNFSMNLSLLRREQSCQPCAPTQTVYENLNLAKTANPDRPQNWHACAICMSPLAGPKDGNADLGSAVAILEATCKHAFHQACLHEWALNNLDVPEKSADGEEFIRLCDWAPFFITAIRLTFNFLAHPCGVDCTHFTPA